MELLIASNNAHKIAEFSGLLAPFGIRAVGARAAGIALDVAETGTTFQENALLKAVAFAQSAGRPALADDSGLVVDALNGEPGVYSARYGGPGLSDADRTQLVLKRLRDVPPPRRTARFVAALALVVPGSDPITIQETVEGSIADGPRGSGGFGYDPIFLYPPAGCTLAELDPVAKGKISHRGRAARAMLPHIRALRGGIL